MKGLPAIVDLCAGTGLFAYAFKLEGFSRIEGGLELDPDKAAAWTANVGAKCHVGDITQLTPSEFRLRFGDPGDRIIVGGIPCQDFSTANRYRTEDTRLRDHVVRLVEDLHPAGHVFENVVRGWRGLRCSVVRDADVGGYTIRERGFWGGPIVPVTHNGGHRKLDGTNGVRPPGWGDAVSGWDWACEMNHQDDWEGRRALRVIFRDESFWTVTSRADVFVWRDDSRKSLRWLTWREMAALQGFPKDWTWPKQVGKTRSAIGDAVPLAMGRGVARAIKEVLA